MATKDLPNARGCEPQTHRGELTVDPSVSPGRVLPCQPQDNSDDPCGNARSTRLVRIGPSATDQVSMPPEQGLGLDEEAPSANSREESTQPGEQCSVRRTQRRARHLTSKDRHLMAEHD